MPMQLIVHALDCPTKRRPCTCATQEFAIPAEAIKATGGDPGRMELGKVTPPPPRLPDPLPPHRSQARRHREISN
jgi:hypothetical protein